MFLLPGSLRRTLKTEFEAETALLGWPFVRVGVMTHICLQKSVAVCVYGINRPYWVETRIVLQQAMSDKI